MTEVLPRDILLRVGGRTLQRTGFLAAMGAGRGYVEVKETFSRPDATTCATLMDRDQVARLAAANLVRIEYPSAFAGLVDQFGYPYCGPSLEGTRINKARRCSELGNAFWTKDGSTTVSADVGLSARGTQSADKLVEAALTELHGISRSFAFAAGDNLCFSAVVEAAGRSKGRIYVRSDAEVNGFRGRFDLVAETATLEGAMGTGSGIAAGVIKLRTGKYRVWVSGKVAGAATTALARLLPNDAAGTDSYLGDGASGIIVSDLQFEVGAFPSSIIPADADLDVTRAGDSLTTPFTFGPMDVTALCRIARPAYAGATWAPTQFPGPWQLGAGANPQAFQFYRSDSALLTSMVRTPGPVDSRVTAAFPAGNEVRLLSQFKNFPTDPETAFDVGSGLSAFSVGTAAAFTQWSSQTLQVGRGDVAGELGGVLLDLIFARGQRSLAEMVAIP